jgi:hypothetical protein
MNKMGYPINNMTNKSLIICGLIITTLAAGQEEQRRDQQQCVTITEVKRPSLSTATRRHLKPMPICFPSHQILFPRIFRSQPWTTRHKIIKIPAILQDRQEQDNAQD